MRIAVTGGAGYIGSVVTEVLIQDGHEVLVLDNLVKGHRDAVAPEAIFAEIDLLDGFAITAMLRGFRCDAVIHMAAASLVGESVTDSSQILSPECRRRARTARRDARCRRAAAGVLLDRCGVRRAGQTADRRR